MHSQKYLYKGLCPKLSTNLIFFEYGMNIILLKQKQTNRLGYCVKCL